jgi:hypothetical protein
LGGFEGSWGPSWPPGRPKSTLLETKVGQGSPPECPMGPKRSPKEAKREAKAFKKQDTRRSRKRLGFGIVFNAFWAREVEARTPANMVPAWVWLHLAQSPFCLFWHRFGHRKPFKMMPEGSQNAPRSPKSHKKTTIKASRQRSHKTNVTMGSLGTSWGHLGLQRLGAGGGHGTQDGAPEPFGNPPPPPTPSRQSLLGVTPRVSSKT